MINKTSFLKKFEEALALEDNFKDAPEAYQEVASLMKASFETVKEDVLYGEQQNVLIHFLEAACEKVQCVKEIQEMIIVDVPPPSEEDLRNFNSFVNKGRDFKSMRNSERFSASILKFLDNNIHKTTEEAFRANQKLCIADLVLNYTIAYGVFTEIRVNQDCILPEEMNQDEVYIGNMRKISEAANRLIQS